MGVWQSAVVRGGCFALAVVVMLPGCSKVEELLQGLTGDDGAEQAADEAEDDDEPEAPERTVIAVENLEQFVAAIGSHRTIEMAPGDYVVTTKDAETLAAKSDNFDGSKIVDVEDLSIVGKGEGVKILSPSQQSIVLEFRNAKKLRLDNLILGHSTETTGCDQGVLQLVGSKDVELHDVEMFGSGAEGLVVLHSQNVLVTDSRVYECSLQLGTFVEAKNVEFRNSSFSGNGKSGNPLLRGFTTSKSTVTFTDVSITDNRGEPKKQDGYNRLFIFDQDEKMHLPDDVEGFIDVPESSRVVFQGGTIARNSFHDAGEGGGRLVFVGTKWSRNTMPAPAGVEVDKSEEGPLTLLDLQVERKGGGLFASGNRYLQLSADAFINDRIEPGTNVLVRSVCLSEDRRLVDAGYLSVTDYTKPMENYGKGQTAKLQGTLYSYGSSRDLEKCEMTFRLGSMGGGLTLPLGTRCFDGSKVHDGACDPPVAAAPMSDTQTEAMTIGELKIDKASNYGGGVALDTHFTIDIHKPDTEQGSMTIKAACRVGDRTVVDVAWASVSMMITAKLEPGESVARYNQLFMDPALGLTDTPEYCDILFRAQTPSVGAPTGYTYSDIHRVCWRETKTTEGECDPGAPPPPAPTRADKDSIKLSNVELKLADYGMAGGAMSQMIEIRADATVKKPVVQGAQITVDARCRVGGTTRVEKSMVSGHDLSMLGPDETTVVRGMVFGSSPLDKKPSSCSVEFRIQPDYYGYGGTTTNPKLGKWCLRGDKTKKC
jgi:hypothetical protein